MADRADEHAAPHAEGTAQVNEERRAALRRIAKFGGYTAPALLVMLTSEPAAAADSA